MADFGRSGDRFISSWMRKRNGRGNTDLARTFTGDGQTTGNDVNADVWQTWYFNAFLKRLSMATAGIVVNKYPVDDPFGNDREIIMNRGSNVLTTVEDFETLGSIVTIPATKPDGLVLAGTNDSLAPQDSTTGVTNGTYSFQIINPIGTPTLAIFVTPDPLPVGATKIKIDITAASAMNAPGAILSDAGLSIFDIKTSSGSATLTIDAAPGTQYFFGNYNNDAAWTTNWDYLRLTDNAGVVKQVLNDMENWTDVDIQDIPGWTITPNPGYNFPEGLGNTSWSADGTQSYAITASGDIVSLVDVASIILSKDIPVTLGTEHTLQLHFKDGTLQDADYPFGVIGIQLGTTAGNNDIFEITQLLNQYSDGIVELPLQTAIDYYGPLPTDIYITVVLNGVTVKIDKLVLLDIAVPSSGYTIEILSQSAAIAFNNVNFLRGLNTKITSQSVAIANSNVNLRKASKLSLTSQAVTITTGNVDYSITVAYFFQILTASLAISNQNIGLLKASRLPIQSRSVALGFQTLNVLRGYKVSLAVLPISIANQSIGLRASRKLSAATASISILPSNWNFQRGRQFVVSALSLSASFNNLALLSGRKAAITTLSTSADLTDVALLRALKLSVATQTYNISNQQISSARTRVLKLSSSSVAIVLSGRLSVFQYSDENPTVSFNYIDNDPTASSFYSDFDPTSSDQYTDVIN